MIVYVVVQQTFGQTEVKKVFATAKAASDYVKAKTWPYNEYWYETHEVEE